MARTPRNAKKSAWDGSKIKIALVGVVFALALGALWGRAWHLQVVRGPELDALAKRQHFGAEENVGERGPILDRNGRLLAREAVFQSVYVRPHEVTDVDRAARILSKALGMSRRDVRARLTDERKFVWVTRLADDRAVSQIRGAKLDGVHFAPEAGRLYPNGHLAGQLLGFVGLDGKGLEGMERQFDQLLAPGRARVTVQRDAAGRTLYLDDEGNQIQAQDGKPVTLTIDAHVQAMAETALAAAINEYDAKSGACLVVEVDTGEILALANYPFFNPNIYRRGTPSQWRNNAGIEVFEPGSTMKPILVAAALQEGLYDPKSILFCENGRWRHSGRTIRDTHEYGWLTINKVVRYSSNIGAAKIALEMGRERYHAYLSALGFGDPTGLPLPGESYGILRQPGEWYPIDLACAGFGQGVGVSALQLAQAYLALASGGVKKPLRLVVEPEQPAGPPVRIFDEKVSRQVLSMMVDVVEMDGTGTQARIPGIVVGGKTGTSQKAVPTGGYGDEYMASFVGLIPGDAPEFIVLAVVDEPQGSYYGGVVAAPVVRDVAMRSLAYMGRLPDAQEPVLALAEQITDTDPNRNRPEVGGRILRRGADATGDVAPRVIGMSLREAVETMAAAGVIPRIEGGGMRVVRQAPKPGQAFKGEADAVLWLSEES
jgi:cell division protein FtsI (penicillin-binding protein 3)